MLSEVVGYCSQNGAPSRALAINENDGDGAHCLGKPWVINLSQDPSIAFAVITVDERVN